MITLETSLRHMAWADHTFFTALANLDDSALALTNGDPEWTVGKAAAHILGGVEWYRYLLLQAQWQGFNAATTSAEVLALRDALKPMNESLVEAALLPEGLISWTEDDGPHEAPRSVVLSQAPYHAAEHRAQITAALHAHGIRDIHLDDYDVWAWYYQAKKA